VIEVFADITCPFAYVGLVRLLARRAVMARDEVVHVRAWPLELVNGEPLTGPGTARKVAELRRGVAPELFQGFDVDRFPASSLPALALAATASRRDPGTGELVGMELRRALFEQGSDISQVAVLDDIARRHGIEGRWDTRDVLVDWEEGRRRGVQGSPHWFVDGEEYVCPALQIDHPAGGLHVTPDPEGFEQLVRHAFPTAREHEDGSVRLGNT
jgi:predicted DsbA family dithiol-disulfide isomerase